jgi:hypothetical protein
MDPVSAVTIFNIVAPHVFALIASLRKKDPSASYESVLRAAGVELDAEYARLLADMHKAVEEGAVPR